MNKYFLRFLDRFFWWIEAWLYLGFSILEIITFTLILETKLLNKLYDFNTWYNTLMLRLENK